MFLWVLRLLRSLAQLLELDDVGDPYAMVYTVVPMEVAYLAASTPCPHSPTQDGYVPDAVAYVVLWLLLDTISLDPGENEPPGLCSLAVALPSLRKMMAFCVPLFAACSAVKAACAA